MGICEVCGLDDDGVGPDTCNCPECAECRAIVSLECLALHDTGMKRYVTLYIPYVGGSKRRWYIDGNVWYDLTRDLANQMSCKLDLKMLDHAADYVFEIKPSGEYTVVKNRFARENSDEADA